MKINYDNIKLKQEEEFEIRDEKDVLTLVNNFKKTYRNVGVCLIDEMIFLYRTLGRKEYRDLIENTALNDMQKEEEICKLCCLFPTSYDFEDCDAGIPTTLANAILKNSFVDIKSRQLVTSLYRKEMNELDNQVTCIINEAFPQFDIEEIENWDIEKTAKYLSRAEWKLVNFRGAKIVADPIMEDETTDEYDDEEYTIKKQEVSTSEIVEDNPIMQDKRETLEERQQRLSQTLSKKGKEKLTPEKLQELKRKYPEMKWGEFVTSTDEIDKYPPHVDSPALRPGW